MLDGLFSDYILFGTRIRCYGEWYLIIKKLHNGFFMAVHRESIMPAPIVLVNQLEADRHYQEVLFRSFGMK